MHIIRVRNVNDALPVGMRYLEGYGVAKHSRAGDVTVAPGPVTTIYDRPEERVIFNRPSASPFFHFWEGIWMLAGRNDLASVTQFVKNMENFSDDGVTLRGAYGHRWRVHWGYDQITKIIALLRTNPNSRRAVLTMWDPDLDLNEDESATKDACCNTQCVFGVSLGKRDESNRLNMTIFNRSNDIIWGLMGANAVHMSMLMEYVAAHLGLVVGTMTTVSVNYHAYLDVFNETYVGTLRAITSEPSPYASGVVSPYPMVTNPETWDTDLASFMSICDYHLSDGKGPAPKTPPYNNSFFYEVARPLWRTHAAYKRKNYLHAFEILEECAATDWRLAAKEWLQRRRARAVGPTEKE